MKGLFSDQVITVIDEETIVWGISCYKKISELVDVDGLEKMWESGQTKENIPQKLRRRFASYTEALLMGACLGLAIGIGLMAIAIKCQAL